jgi:hypothetical protein
MDVCRGESSAGIATLYGELAAVCVEEGATRALVVSGRGDPTTSERLTRILAAMNLLEMRPGFRIAVVARTPTMNRVYKAVEEASSLQGIRVRVFWTEHQAAAWLMGPRSLRGARSLPRAPASRTDGAAL